MQEYVSNFGAQISLLPRQCNHAGMKGRYSARRKHKDNEILGGERQIEEMGQVLNKVGDYPKGS